MSLKNKWQRIYRGYSDEDVKNVSSFLIEKLQPVLKAYVTYEAEKGRALPKEFTADPATWLQILREIEYAFDNQFAEEFEEGYRTDTEENKEAHYARVKEGFRLFGQWCRELKS